jgi:hypothetical protein
MIPLRVDFGGGWLDVPKFSRIGAYIVNCTISPLVGDDDWEYEKRGGLGGSAAWAILSGKDGVESEIDLGVGWQDPAVIRETGLCVWRSGPRPVLETKTNPDFLAGLMGLLWLGDSHDTPGIVDKPRDYDRIAEAGRKARDGAIHRRTHELITAIWWSYTAQVREGMATLPIVPGSVAMKYCGGGWGGYSLYLFPTRALRDASGLMQIEPYMREA